MNNVNEITDTVLEIQDGVIDIKLIFEHINKNLNLNDNKGVIKDGKISR